ncbi:phytanoyl-CoA dioxygenase [Spirosoma sp. HMF4905]|uniref:Phytanoyl-CoA dioxygenase n=1 Tax=Spirosoma arboris TaxID=2682092 RepID=A0A7K1S9M6_9BACT|nr:phytanoyl-CoA dioxygenase family protein [Spirosoma arboris]MVM30509.1 phytanoyl-CoA dioxygenase [Spirosoma arboris]
MGNTLDSKQIQDFVQKGFVRIDQAFSSKLAEEGRTILWADTGCDPNNPATWTKPVIRLGNYGQEPFRQAANTPCLLTAFDQLVGPGRWLPRTSLGTFPIRFPSPDDPGDAGWHIDVSFASQDDDPNDFLSWRANINSKGRALLMLFLFSTITENDAPTRIRVGSHVDIARQLEPAGEAGLTLRDLAANGFQETAGRQVVTATGEAGTVYLCHPFLVHAAQAHHGSTPRFLAQPPLLPAESLQLERPNGDYSPVEQAIRLALATN